MENFIPSSPYYFYMGGAPFSPCDGQYSFVIFDRIKSPVTIGGDTLKMLTGLIQPSGIKAVSRNDYYYNSSGPNVKPGFNKDEIYIECNPTGEDGEILFQTPPTMGSEIGSALSMDNLMQNPYLNVAIGIGLSYMALKIVGKILS
jgi:hypothetical protein